MHNPSTAFTVKSTGGKFRELVSDAHVKLARSIEQTFNINSPIAKVKAIWDTGATNTVISHKLAKQLKLAPTGKIPVHGVNSKSIVNTY